MINYILRIKQCCKEIDALRDSFDDMKTNNFEACMEVNNQIRMLRKKKARLERARDRGRR